MAKHAKKQVAIEVTHQAKSVMHVDYAEAEEIAKENKLSFTEAVTLIAKRMLTPLPAVKSQNIAVEVKLSKYSLLHS